MKKFLAVFVFGLLLTACGTAPAEETAPKNTSPATNQTAEGLTGYERCVNGGGQILGEKTPHRCLLDARMYLEKVEK
ncbi:hypothetical protein HN954_04375 [bacterium]|jgi:hypothetical protein|nr:hypothetical protein [bacterium]MBT6831940.1 hypothetical protein [bacterium]MBT6996636.1 hypothetical protein [bacterium]MBT7773056.1 hypothetical protein [bacterium]